MRKKIRMALYDSDGYMAPLVNYLCRKKREIVETRLFTSLSLLKDHVRGGQVDVLLALEEESDGLYGLQAFVPKIILLTEGNMVEEQSFFHLVFRYQSAEEVVREVLEEVAEDDRIAYGGAVVASRQSEVISGYSPFGGGGLSTFLVNLAEGLAENYRTLYVSLEEFHGLETPALEKKERTEDYRGMSEVIFYLQQRKEKLALKLDSLVHEGKRAEYLLAVENYRDLHQMNREDMGSFFQTLCHETPYEKIVFDVGYLGEAGEYVLEHSDKIYMPIPNTKAQEMKQSACEQGWQRQGYGEILEKIYQVAMGGE